MDHIVVCTGIGKSVYVLTGDLQKLVRYTRVQMHSHAQSNQDIHIIFPLLTHHILPDGSCRNPGALLQLLRCIGPGKRFIHQISECLRHCATSEMSNDFRYFQCIFGLGVLAFRVDAHEVVPIVFFTGIQAAELKLLVIYRPNQVKQETTLIQRG